MPLLWRYLLAHYLKVFTLSVIAFIAILLTMRLDEIAYFATLGADGLHVAWFTLQQVPYILPIALPVSGLIAAILLVQGLSHSKELVAMRASGYALRDILAPVILASLFLSAFNFYVVSELSTKSHLSAGLLKNQLRSINPLLLLHNKHVMRMKGFYFDTMGPSHVGEFAQDIVFFSPNKHSNRLNMMIAKQLQASPSNFAGQQVSLLTTQQVKENQDLEHLILENMNTASTTIQDFSQMLEKKIWSVNNDHLSLPLLLVRLHETKAKLVKMRLEASVSKEDLKNARCSYNQCWTEIFRRLSVGFAVFSFTFMGLAFGIGISRNQTNKGIVFVIILAALYLVTFFVAKNFSHSLVAALLLYLLPQLLICGAALWMLHRLAYGVE